MRIFKRAAALLILLAVLCCGFSGCGSETKSSADLNIVCTIFPYYDWAREIVGKSNRDIDITLMLDKGVDLHSFQPSALDIRKIADCDIFIYTGGESDQWVEDTLSQTNGVKAINLLEILGDDAVQIQSEEENETEPDEHVWLSIKNAKKFCNAICSVLCKADAKNKDTYKSNTEKYVQRLDSLDTKYKSVVKSSAKSSLVFCDRFPFTYLARDYGIDYYAAFPGCGAETNVSFKVIRDLAEKTDEDELNAVMITESGDKKICNTVKDNTKNRNQKILTMDSMQSVKGQDIEEGTTYLGIMESNCQMLKEALN